MKIRYNREIELELAYAARAEGGGNEISRNGVGGGEILGVLNDLRGQYLGFHAGRRTVRGLGLAMGQSEKSTRGTLVRGKADEMLIRVIYLDGNSKP